MLPARLGAPELREPVRGQLPLLEGLQAAAAAELGVSQGGGGSCAGARPPAPPRAPGPQASFHILLSSR